VRVIKLFFERKNCSFFYLLDILNPQPNLYVCITTLFAGFFYVLRASSVPSKCIFYGPPPHYTCTLYYASLWRIYVPTVLPLQSRTTDTRRTRRRNLYLVLIYARQYRYNSRHSADRLFCKSNRYRYINYNTITNRNTVVVYNKNKNNIIIIPCSN